MPVQRLIAVLEQLSAAHEAMIELADQKREALVRNAVDEVSAVVQKETKWMRAVENLLKEQRDATVEFFRSRGFQPTRAVTVTELSRMITDRADKETLLQARDRLSDVVARLQAKNDLNQQLIEHSLAFINYSLDLVAGPEDDLMYRNPHQQQTPGLKRSGYFDSRA